MKQGAIHILCTLGLLISLQLNAVAQDSTRVDIFYRMTRALNQKDTGTLMESASRQVELGLLDTPSVFSSTQAKYVLSRFFRTNPTGMFEFDDVRSSGQEVTANGSYRSDPDASPRNAFLLLRERKGTWELRELRISERAVVN